MARFTRNIWNKRLMSSTDVNDHGRVVSWRRPSKESGGVWRWTFDFGLGAAGAGAAVASAAFAFFMMQADIKDPQFGGSEYLLLFTRPLHPAGEPSQQVATRFESRGIDFIPTGSIGPARSKTVAETRDLTQAPDELVVSAPPPLPLKDYVLKTVRGGIAVVKGPKGDFLAEIGTLLPNGDLVISIDRRGGHWVVVTSSGLIQDQ